MAIPDATETGFRHALEDDPNNWTTRLIFADWLEERGLLDEGAGQRYQARNERRPLKDVYPPSEEESWRWYTSPQFDDDDDPESSLPLVIFIYLQQALHKEGWADYPTLKEAEDDLGLALKWYLPSAS